MTACRAMIVVQARTGSTRLPGKVGRDLDGRSVLRHCLERLRAGRVIPVVLATTWRTEDDALVREARDCGIAAVRGATADVLGRFVMVAERYAPEIVIRATADNPAVDCDAPERVLEILTTTGADYALERQLPVGAAVEGVRTAALLHAAERTSSSYDREHVTPFLRRAENGYHIVEPEAPTRLCRPDLRFTVDTQADLAYMARVFAQAGRGRRPVPLADLIGAADRVAGLQEVA